MLLWGLGPDPVGIVAEAPTDSSNFAIPVAEGIVMSTPQWRAQPGRWYVIRTSNLHWQSTVSTDIVQWQLRIAQNGAAPSLAAPRVAAAPGVAHVANAQRGDSNWLMYPTNNLTGYCTVSLTVFRISGSGACSTPLAYIRPRQLWVEDRGT